MLQLHYLQAGICRVKWSWSSHFRRFANVLAHSRRCCIGAFTGAWDVIFRWIRTVRSKANRFQVYSTVAAADRKWCVKRLKSTELSSESRNPSRKHVRHTRNQRGKLLPMCFRQGEKLSEWTRLAWKSPNPSKKNTSSSLRRYTIK